MKTIRIYLRSNSPRTIERTAETGEPYSVCFRVLTRDGSLRWMRSRARPRRDAAGAIAASLAAAAELGRTRAAAGGRSMSPGAGRTTRRAARASRSELATSGSGTSIQVPSSNIIFRRAWAPILR